MVSKVAKRKVKVDREGRKTKRRNGCAKTKKAVSKGCFVGKTEQVRRKAMNGIVHSRKAKRWNLKEASSKVIKSKVLAKRAVKGGKAQSQRQSGRVKRRHRRQRQSLKRFGKTWCQVAKRKVKVDREVEGKIFVGHFGPLEPSAQMRGQRQKGLAKAAKERVFSKRWVKGGRAQRQIERE